MSCRKFIIIAAFFVSIYPAIGWSQQSTSLPRSTPEAEGVSANDISNFIDAANQSKNEFHSFMLVRHGKVIAEGWWNPYRADLKHTLYSCSKSFTATAVGFAVTEKKLSLDDKVTSFFPHQLPDTVGKYLSELTVKDVLMMSDGMDPDPSFAVAGVDSDWVKGFLATRIVNEPRTKFLYNSLGTYMLSAIVQEVTGEKVIDYLKPRLFEPLGITGEDWETDTKGINTGGWGLRVKTEDMAKFAELFLQKGKWNGKQIIPASWVEEASTMKIMQDPNAPQSKKDSSDWLQGYCYQMWRCRYNAYRGDGAYGQFMIVMPDQDAVLAITAETANMQDEINIAWKYLLPALKTNSLAADGEADAKLKEKIKALALPLPAQNLAITATQNINSKTYSINQNQMHLKSIGFNFKGDVCQVKFETDASSYQFNFGKSKWEYAETNMPRPSLTAAGIENTSMTYPAKVAASYAWTDENTLQLVLRYIESPHTEYFTCHFDGNKLSVEESKSFNYGKNTVMLEGTEK